LVKLVCNKWKLVRIVMVLGYKGETCEPWLVLAIGVRPVSW
jgi:hypothetical protein